MTAFGACLTRSLQASILTWPGMRDDANGSSVMLTPQARANVPDGAARSSGSTLFDGADLVHEATQIISQPTPVHCDILLLAIR